MPIDRLQVDPAYQRATEGAQSRRIILGMVREWQWPLCQPLVVARRIDGSLWVLDGQHRLAGARARGDLPYLPCVILSGLALEQEAGAFVGLNTRRQRLSQADIFNGMLAAGDAEARAVAALLEETGWRIKRSSNTQGLKPGDLTCAPMLARHVKWSGEAPVRAALSTLRAAWPGTPVTVAARLLEALVQLFKRGLAAEPAGVANTLAQQSPLAWIKAGERLAMRDPALSRTQAIVAAIHAAHFGAAPAGPARTPPPGNAPARPAATAALIEPRFGTEGKGWCDQCETLVDRPRAAACAWAFCGMKAKAA